MARTATKAQPATAVPLPAGRWRNVLDGGEYDGATLLRVATLLERFPVALLERLA